MAPPEENRNGILLNGARLEPGIRLALGEGVGLTLLQRVGLALPEGVGVALQEEDVGLVLLTGV